MPTPLVIYHADCMDGLAAAWAVSKAHHNGVELHAAQYPDPPPPNCAGRDVIIVDLLQRWADANGPLPIATVGAA
jgi:hypothetical protein